MSLPNLENVLNVTKICNYNRGGDGLHVLSLATKPIRDYRVAVRNGAF